MESADEGVACTACLAPMEPNVNDRTVLTVFHHIFCRHLGQEKSRLIEIELSVIICR
jgi:hypothetical protein